jgi:required for meiotic nuclear division protein 1
MVSESPPSKFMGRTLAAAGLRFRVRAILVGERIDLKSFGAVNTLATNPLTVEVQGGGGASLFRFGVVVFFAVAPMEEASFLRELQPLVAFAYAEPEIEELEVQLEPGTDEVLKAGVIHLEDRAIERLQVIADILSKSVLLALYEKQVSSEFDHVEQLATELQSSGRIPGKGPEFLRKIGTLLLVEQRMVGRAEITEKPEILWDNPGLEGLFARLEDEFELRERHSAIERKLGLISRTSHTLLELLSSRHALRVEWYIVILIVLEILLSLYTLIFR